MAEYNRQTSGESASQVRNQPKLRRVWPSSYDRKSSPIYSALKKVVPDKSRPKTFAGTTGSTCLILLFKFFYWTSSQVR